jgi:hypothetical protein
MVSHYKELISNLLARQATAGFCITERPMKSSFVAQNRIVQIVNKITQMNRLSSF